LKKKKGKMRSLRTRKSRGSPLKCGQTHSYPSELEPRKRVIRAVVRGRRRRASSEREG